MGVPISQAVRVGTYIMKQKLKGVKRYPLVMMLEPLYRCNLACHGCGKIQHPEEILKQHMPVQQALDAAEECGAPMVSIAGGEPLIHPEIDKIVDGLVKRKKYVYLCTNALLLEKKLDKFTPSDFLTFNVHIDGLEDHHDKVTDRPGCFKKAVKAIKAARAKGFRVNTNTTVFDGEKPENLHEMFDTLMDAGVNAMTLSPGYAYEKAPDQDHFLKREKTKSFFQKALDPNYQGLKAATNGNGDRKPQHRKWNFNHSPLYLDFLQGKVDFQCTPWGNPNYGLFGWQKPCYLFSEGYAATFKELMEETDWDKYGTGNHEKCADCMTHCGYEPTAVIETTKSMKESIRSFVSVLN